MCSLNAMVLCLILSYLKNLELVRSMITWGILGCSIAVGINTGYNTRSRYMIQWDRAAVRFYDTLLAIVDISDVQSSAQTFIHNVILFIDTSNNASHNQAHRLFGTPYLSTIASNGSLTILSTSKQSAISN